MEQTDLALLSNHVEGDPHRPGPGDVRLRPSLVPVWAIIGYLQANGWDVDDVRDAYEITRDEVAAAIAYYRLERETIEARLAANRGEGVPAITGVVGLAS